ncbi:hypothetical protein ACFLQL_03300 [Verrucomicrobiota bacterium]
MISLTVFKVKDTNFCIISKQIRNGTAGGILSKPVSRELFFSTTYCGIVLVCLLFTAIAVIAALLSVRMALQGIHTDWLIGVIFAAGFLLAFAVAGVLNYRGQNFCSTLFKMFFFCLLTALIITAFFDPGGRLVVFGSLIRWELLAMAIMIFMALAMLASIAVTLSARSAPVVVLSCCCLVFVLGLISDYLIYSVFGSGFLSGMCASIFPDWHIFWIYGDIEEGNAVNFGYVLKACGYAALYISGVLCLGILSFKSAEIS